MKLPSLSFFPLYSQPNIHIFSKKRVTGGVGGGEIEAPLSIQKSSKSKIAQLLVFVHLPLDQRLHVKITRSIPGVMRRSRKKVKATSLATMCAHQPKNYNHHFFFHIIYYYSNTPHRLFLLFSQEEVKEMSAQEKANIKLNNKRTTTMPLIHTL